FNNEYITLSKETISLKKANNSEYLTLISKEGPPLVNGVLDAAEELIALETESLHQVRDETLSDVKESQHILIILSILALAVGTIVASIISRQISNPVKSMAKTAELIAAGDLTQKKIE